MPCVKSISVCCLLALFSLLAAAGCQSTKPSVPRSSYSSAASASAPFTSGSNGASCH